MIRKSSTARRRALLSTLIAATAVVGLAACSGGNAPSSSGGASGSAGADLSLNWALTNTPTSLDPDPKEGTATKSPLVNVMGSLFSYNDETGETATLSDLKPDLATDITASADGLTQTVTLRKGVKSTPGNEFTAADIDWTIKRAQNHKAGVLTNLKATNLDLANPITIVDPYTVQFHLTAPNSLFKNLISNIGWLDSAEITKNATTADPWGDTYMMTHSASFGPYTVSAFTPGEKVTYNRNPNYWNGKSDVATVTLIPIPDSSTRLQSIISGDLDIAWIDLATKSQLDSASNVKSFVQPGGSSSEIAFDFQSAKVSDVRLRQAINLALDRDAINSAGFSGNASPVTACVPEDWGGTETADSPKATADVTAAKAALAGYSGGTDLTLAINSGASGQEEIARVVQSDLAAIGVTVSINSYASYSTFTADLGQHKSDMYLYGSYPAIQEAGFFFQNFWTAGSVYNPFGWNDPAFDATVATIQTSLDPAARTAAVTKACGIFAADMPAAQVAIAGNLVGLSSRLTNYVNLPDATVNFFNIKAAG